MRDIIRKTWGSEQFLHTPFGTVLLRAPWQMKFERLKGINCRIKSEPGSHSDVAICGGKPKTTQYNVYNTVYVYARVYFLDLFEFAIFSL